MKYTTIQLGDNKIELFNSILGKETIKVNGETVSSAYSMLGGDHSFTINENGQEVDCSITYGFGVHGVVFDLYKDGVPVIKSEKSGYLGLTLLMLIIFGITIALSLVG